MGLSLHDEGPSFVMVLCMEDSEHWPLDLHQHQRTLFNLHPPRTGQTFHLFAITPPSITPSLPLSSTIFPHSFLCPQH